MTIQARDVERLAAAAAENPPFVERLNHARGRQVVVHTLSGHTYAGVLRSADRAVVCIEGESDTFDARCVIEIDAARVEAIEIIGR